MSGTSCTFKMGRKGREKSGSGVAASRRVEEDKGWEGSGGVIAMVTVMVLRLPERKREGKGGEW